MQTREINEYIKDVKSSYEYHKKLLVKIITIYITQMRTLYKLKVDVFWYS